MRHNHSHLLSIQWTRATYNQMPIPDRIGNVRLSSRSPKSRASETAVAKPDQKAITTRPGHPPPTRCVQYQLDGSDLTGVEVKLVYDSARSRSCSQFEDEIIDHDKAGREATMGTTGA